MRYDQKLDIIVAALVEAKKATIGQGPTSLYLDANSGLNIFDERELREILHKIESETDVIHVLDGTNRLLSPSEQPKNPGYILIYVFDGFDKLSKGYFVPQSHDAEKVVFNFDRSTAILGIGGKEVKFRLEGGPALLLGMLTRNKESGSLAWYDVYEKLEGVELSSGKHRKEKQKIFNLAAGVTNRIANETSFVNFLLFDFDRVRLNPGYVRLKK
jgi:hypothetical protein